MIAVHARNTGRTHPTARRRTSSHLELRVLQRAHLPAEHSDPDGRPHRPGARPVQRSRPHDQRPGHRQPPQERYKGLSFGVLRARVYT